LAVAFIRLLLIYIAHWTKPQDLQSFTSKMNAVLHT
jgi:hypothetical protein